MKKPPITGLGILWGFTFAFIGLFIPGIIPLGFLGPLGPVIGIIIGAWVGLTYGAEKTRIQNEKAEIHQHNLQEARKNK